MSKLIVSLSPHAHGNDSVERNMYGVIIALIPALLVSLIGFGLGSLVVLASSIAACVFFEWSITKYILKKEPTILDGSAILTGLLLGFNLPSSMDYPYWCFGCHWHWQNVVWRFGLQPFQSCIGRSLLPSCVFPCTDDFLAYNRSAHLLY